MSQRPSQDRLTSRLLRLVLLLAVGGFTTAARVLAAEPADRGAVFSDLWGQRGEKWDPAGRLPDFSYAGYRRGLASLPQPAAAVSVTDFGAVGDGVTDDTAAFQRALRDAAGQTIRIPAGIYLITDLLEVTTPGTILRGDGSGETVLRMPKPLDAMRPNMGATTGGRPTSNYSWSGGIIWVKGRLASTTLAEVTAPAKRGGRQLELASTSGVSVGDEVRLIQRDADDQSLARHLYQGQSGPIENLSSVSVALVAMVTDVDPKTRRITIDRHLTTDVDLKWSPRLDAAASSVEEVGIEGLAFQFPNRPYEGHFTEVGFNAIAMSGTRNCWIRDIRVHNCDSGFFISGVNTTVTDVQFSSERRVEPARKATGHHGITLGGQDNLLSDFVFETRFMHDITVSRGSSGNVAMRGRGLDLCFDHHRYAPHSNLFTDIDLGEGSRMFQSGGGAALGRHSAAWETFWGIDSKLPLAWPENWGPELMNFVGLTSDQPAVKAPQGRWFEPLNPQRLEPRNLYDAQRHLRMETQTQP